MKFRLVEHILDESKADEQRLIDFAGEDIAQRFFKLKQRFKSPENDLYYWIKNKTPQELEQAVSKLENTKSKTQQKKEMGEGAKLICETEHYKVYHITTYEASQKYGKGTKWCVSGNQGSGSYYWGLYTKDRNGQFYFIIDKSGDGTKFAILLYPHNQYQAFDWYDNLIEVYDIPYIDEIDIPGVTFEWLELIEQYCDNCDAPIGEDGQYWAYDNCYCQSCYEELFTECVYCGEPIDRNSATHPSEDGGYICDACFEDNEMEESILDEASIDPEGKYTDYGTGNVTSDNIFDDRPHIPDYDRLISNPKYMAEKENLKGHIDMMSPKEYYEECANKIFNCSVESLVNGRKRDTVVNDEIKEIIVKYKRQVFLPVLNLAQQEQEGLHRMLVAAELFGWDHKFPVLVVEWVDEELAQQRKKAKEEDRIRRYIKDAVIDTLRYTFDNISEFEEEVKSQVDYKFDFIEEPVKSFSVKHNNDETTDVEVNNVVYQFDTDRIKVEPSRENSDNVDELEWDDLDIELDDLSDEELSDLNDLSLDDFLKKYGL